MAGLSEEYFSLVGVFDAQNQKTEDKKKYRRMSFPRGNEGNHQFYQPMESRELFVVFVSFC